MQGLTKARQLYGDTIVSIGIDAFGNGYGLQASDGRLLGLPYHYRDPRHLKGVSPSFHAFEFDCLFYCSFIKILWHVNSELNIRGPIIT